MVQIMRKQVCFSHSGFLSQLLLHTVADAAVVSSVAAAPTVVAATVA
jgi:hypothetical protein